MTFTKVNSVTYRINKPHKREAVGWLMEIAWPSERQRWVACVRNHRSEPLPLEEAKKAAKAFLALKTKGEVAELNDYALEALADSTPLLNISDEPPVSKEDWSRIVETECGRTDLPIVNGLINGIFANQAELAAYQRELKTLQGDDLTHDENGFPELPACLDRRPPVAEAA